MAMQLLAGSKFFEVDLPSAVDAKKRILATRSPSINVEHLPLNLEDLKSGPSLPDRLASSTSFDASKPTLYVFEAVLFYLSPPAKKALLADGADEFLGHDGVSVVEWAGRVEG